MSDVGKNLQTPVPQIMLIDTEGEHLGVQGSYCWDGICVDYALPSNRRDLQEKLELAKGATITFKVKHPVVPKQLYVTIFSGEKMLLHKAVGKKMKVQVPKGTYFLDVRATWNGQGDVSNVFFIEVL